MRERMLVMVMVMASLAGCIGADYGSPTPDTHVRLDGESTWARPFGFDLVGKAVTYWTDGGPSSPAVELPTDRIEDMISAFEDVNFLYQYADLSSCDYKSADAPEFVIQMELTGGSNEVYYPMDCQSEKLNTLVARLRDRSGLDAWQEAVSETSN